MFKKYQNSAKISANNCCSRLLSPKCSVGISPLLPIPYKSTVDVFAVGNDGSYPWTQDHTWQNCPRLAQSCSSTSLASSKMPHRPRQLGTLFRPWLIFQLCLFVLHCRLTPQSYPDPAICSKFGCLPTSPVSIQRCIPGLESCTKQRKPPTAPTISATLSVPSSFGPGASTGASLACRRIRELVFLTKHKLQQLGSAYTLVHRLRA
jgi:hypothetical protein